MSNPENNYVQLYSIMTVSVDRNSLFFSVLFLLFDPLAVQMCTKTETDLNSLNSGHPDFNEIAGRSQMLSPTKTCLLSLARPLMNNYFLRRRTDGKSSY